jgi:hypothetical protein
MLSARGMWDYMLSEWVEEYHKTKPKKWKRDTIC